MLFSAIASMLQGSISYYYGLFGPGDSRCLTCVALPTLLPWSGYFLSSLLDPWSVPFTSNTQQLLFRSGDFSCSLCILTMVLSIWVVQKYQYLFHPHCEWWLLELQRLLYLLDALWSEQVESFQGMWSLQSSIQVLAALVRLTWRASHTESGLFPLTVGTSQLFSFWAVCCNAFVFLLPPVVVTTCLVAASTLSPPACGNILSLLS